MAVEAEPAQRCRDAARRQRARRVQRELVICNKQQHTVNTRSLQKLLTLFINSRSIQLALLLHQLKFPLFQRSDYYLIKTTDRLFIKTAIVSESA